MRKLIGVFVLLLLFLSGCGTSKSEYQESVRSVADDILDTVAKVENVSNLYLKVWNFSIGSSTAYGVDEFVTGTDISESDVREYFKINVAGNVPGDFSTNVLSAVDMLEAKGDLKIIKDEADSIKGKVKELKDVPKGLEKAHDELLSLYSDFEKLKEMAIDPTGSLQDYKQNKNKLTEEILSKYKNIELLID